jgi:hypothetical protein
VLWVHRVRGGSPRTRKYLLLGGLSLCLRCWSGPTMSFGVCSCLAAGRPGFRMALSFLSGP